MSKKEVENFYENYGIREWKRLNRDPFHRLEFDTTIHFLKKYLPKKGLILDAGGGPGRYTIELAKMGYTVILLDLTPKMLEIAMRNVKREKLEDKVKIVKGSIDNLSVFDDNYFDAVICLGGVLSHLLNKKQRERAIDELIRVAKKNAPIFVSVIGRLAVLVRGLTLFPNELDIKGLYTKITNTGNYYGGYGFCPFHAFLPEELREAFEKRKVKVLEMVGLEGLSSGHQRETNRLFKKYPKGWEIWWKIHLRTCTNPSVVGISKHFMIIIRK